MAKAQSNDALMQFDLIPGKDHLTEEQKKVIPDEYYMEALTFRKYCQSKPDLYQYFDCDCLSRGFFDERVNAGPEKSRDSIMLTIDDGRCVDATEEGLNVFNRCLANNLMLPSNLDPEEYCGCSATIFTQLLEKAGVRVTPQLMLKAQTQAQVSCRKPDFIERLRKR